MPRSKNFLPQCFIQPGHFQYDAPFTHSLYIYTYIFEVLPPRQEAIRGKYWELGKLGPDLDDRELQEKVCIRAFVCTHKRERNRKNLSLA